MVFMPGCRHCAEGPRALCEPSARATARRTSLLSDGKRIRPRDQAARHRLGSPAFDGYAVVSYRSAVKIDKQTPLADVDLFGCAVLTGVGAVANAAGVKPEQTLTIVGLGLAALIGRYLLVLRRSSPSTCNRTNSRSPAYSGPLTSSTPRMRMP